MFSTHSTISSSAAASISHPSPPIHAFLLIAVPRKAQLSTRISILHLLHSTTSLGKPCHVVLPLRAVPLASFDPDGGHGPGPHPQTGNNTPPKDPSSIKQPKRKSRVPRKPRGQSREGHQQSRPTNHMEGSQDAGVRNAVDPPEQVDGCPPSLAMVTDPWKPATGEEPSPGQSSISAPIVIGQEASAAMFEQDRQQLSRLTPAAVPDPWAHGTLRNTGSSTYHTGDRGGGASTSSTVINAADSSAWHQTDGTSANNASGSSARSVQTDQVAATPQLSSDQMLTSHTGGARSKGSIAQAVSQAFTDAAPGAGSRSTGTASGSNSAGSTNDLRSADAFSNLDAATAPSADSAFAIKSTSGHQGMNSTDDFSRGGSTSGAPEVAGASSGEWRSPYGEQRKGGRRRGFFRPDGFPELRMPLDEDDVDEFVQDVEERALDEYSSAPGLNPVSRAQSLSWAFTEDWKQPQLKRGGRGGRYLVQYPSEEEMYYGTASQGLEPGERGGLSKYYTPNYPVQIDLGASNSPGDPLPPQQWSYTRLLESSREPQRRLERFAALGRISDAMEDEVEDEDDAEGLDDVMMMDDPLIEQDGAEASRADDELGADSFGRDLRYRAGKEQQGAVDWQQDAAWFDQEFDREYGDMAAMRRGQAYRKRKVTKADSRGDVGNAGRPGSEQQKRGGRGRQGRNDEAEEDVDDDDENIDPQDELLGLDPDTILADLDNDDVDSSNDGRERDSQPGGGLSVASAKDLSSQSWVLDRTVRLSGLNPELEEEEWTAALMKTLGPCGTVERLFIEQDADEVGTGEGLIQFESPVAKARALALDGISIEGCKVSIKDTEENTQANQQQAAPIQPPPGGWLPIGDNSNTIFVKGLDTKYSEEQLRLALWEVFRTAGRILQIRLPMDRARRPTGIAYIVYDTPAAKAKAGKLDSCEILGRAVKVDIDPSSTKTGSRQISRQPDASQRTARPAKPRTTPSQGRRRI